MLTSSFADDICDNFAKIAKMPFIPKTIRDHKNRLKLNFISYTEKLDILDRIVKMKKDR